MGQKRMKLETLTSILQLLRAFSEVRKRFFLCLANKAYQILPLRALPKYHRNVNGERFMLSSEESADHFSRAICHRFDKYSQLKRLDEKLTTLWQKRTQQKLFLLIGEITLIHAGLEQRMKTVLIKYTNPSAKERKKIFGGQLRDLFKGKISYIALSSELNLRMSDWIERFESISIKRNDSVKTMYSYDHQNLGIASVDDTVFVSYRKEGNAAKKDISSWIVPTELNDLDIIRKDLKKLQEEMFYIEWDLRKNSFSNLGVKIPQPK